MKDSLVEKIRENKSKRLELLQKMVLKCFTLSEENGGKATEEVQKFTAMGYLGGESFLHRYHPR